MSANGRRRRGVFWWPGLSLLSLLSFRCASEPASPGLESQVRYDDDIEDYLAAFPFDAYEIVEVPQVGRFYVDDNAASVKSTLRQGKAWEPHVIRQFQRYVTPGTTVLDVGAHIGSLTIPLAGLVGPEGRVYAFEPQRKVFRELVHNIRLNNLSNAIPLRMAASSEPGVIEMNPTGRYDGRVKIGEGGDTAEKRTIDSFGFTDVSMIKIDVEGHEADVLKGAEKTIVSSHPVIIVEIFERNVNASKVLLEHLGYELRHLKGADYIAVFED